MAVRVTLAVALANLLLVGATGNSGMICCLEDDGQELRVRSLNAFRAAESKYFDVKKTCILIAIPPEDCEMDGATACEQGCEEKMTIHPTYIRMMELRSRSAYKITKNDAESELATASKQKDMQWAAAEQALKEVQDMFVLRNATLVQRKAELEQAQKVLEDAEQAMDEAAETLVKLTVFKQDEEHYAAVELEKTQAAIEATVEEARTQIQKIEDEKRATEAQMTKDGKIVSEPKECGGDEYCCCSIRFTPVKVMTSQFVDWDECKAPQAYPTESKDGCKDTMVYCPKCAALLCEDNGLGVCPG